jgi:2-polyprenyl-6-methoxyphenol hydroxylase-like FAD-dependent oxidoreductase
MTAPESRTDVLIVGAGPTGLVLALWLAKLGVRARIVDKAPRGGTTSRAVAVQARTLELYHQVGLADAVLAAGVKVDHVNLWSKGEKRGQIDLHVGRALSPYPFVVLYPQDEHEKLLAARLAELGITIERGVEVTELEPAVPAAVLRHPDGRIERVAARFVIGCDGAHSAVRHALGIDFPGGTYSHVFYVADAAIRGPEANGELHIAIQANDFVGVFPLGGNHVRLIGSVQREGDDLTWNDVDQTILSELRIEVEAVKWFSVYRVHHRVASAFRGGALFLCGDAAHIHSPVGGQGMNTGIGDAINLAWKLAAVLHGSDDRVLDSYEAERIPFARRLVATTDRAFEVVTNDSKLAHLARARIPSLIGRLFRIGAVRELAFRTISQLEIRYPDSELSAGHAGKVRGGDRLPWAGTNFEPLDALAWQVHIYGEAPDSARAACEALHLPLHLFAFDDAAEHAGFARGAAYLVRPDGYVALALPAQRVAPDALEAYFTERGLKATPRS